MTAGPGLGGTPDRPPGYMPPDQPGVAAGSPNVIRARQVIIVGTGGELLVYTPTAAAGNLIASIAAAATTDQFNDNVLQAVGSYGPGFAAALAAGFVQFYTGSLAAGWTVSATIETDTLGDIILLAKAGRTVTTNNNTLDDGAGGMAVTSLTVGGSANTGSGNNGGVTSGPSGTVNAFPAAGPNHTHAEVHQHPL